MRIIATLIVAVISSLFCSSEVWAVADDATKHPEVKYPLFPVSESSNPYQIVIEGGYGSGIRKFAKEVRTKVPGLKIYGADKCSEHRGATCVKIVKRHTGVGKAYAFATYPDYTERRITINLDMPHDNRYAVIVHEFGHVLGLGHHAEQTGVCGGVSDKVHLSRSEARTLRVAYPDFNRR